MDARSAIELFGWNVLMPVGISMAALVLLSRVLPERFAAGIALAIAVLSGVAVVSLTGSEVPKDVQITSLDMVRQFAGRLEPSRHWHWIVWLPAICVLPFGLGLRDGVHPAKRGIAIGIVAAVTAFLLTPGWPRLDDLRTLYRSILCVTAAAACMAIDFAAIRTRPGWLLSLAGGSLLATSALLGAFLSVTFGSLLAICSAAVLGIAAVRFKSESTETARVVGPIAALLLVSGCFIGFVDADPPLSGFLVPLVFPAVPMMFALRQQEKKSIVSKVCEVACAVLVFASAATFLHLETRPEEPASSVIPEQPVEEPVSEEDWFDSLDQLGPADSKSDTTSDE